VEAFAKNSKLKGFQGIVPTSLHTYADVISETAFDSLPERCKWDHAIELEREPSPGFCKVYLMTLTEQMEMDISELHPSETPEAPWDVISMDFIVELPESHGYDTIMNVVSGVAGRVCFIPVCATVSSGGAAHLFLGGVWRCRGTPQVVLSDRGPQFIARFTCKLYKLLGIKLAMSTAYHPQTNGQTEHVNQVLEGYLWTFTSQ
jgi:hypothetical protein